VVAPDGGTVPDHGRPPSHRTPRLRRLHHPLEYLEPHHRPSNPLTAIPLYLDPIVRGRLAGVNNEWGPTCRFKIDPVQAA